MTYAREEWTVIARKQGETEGIRLFISENSHEEAAAWLADRPQPPGTETAIVTDPLGPDAPFPSRPGLDLEISHHRSPHWRVVTRAPGQESGRSVAVSSWSRDHLEAWLARNPQPAGNETLILEDGEEGPWPAPQDATTAWFTPPSRELSNFLALARRGRFHSMPAIEAQARNIALAVLEHARDLDDDSIEFAIPELIRWAQEGEDARDEIRELLEVSR